ncbi:MAG: SPASM domain-containing protein, partial [Candidatus Omnitrophica bacterium]|nr:SPASM domain-containing protein [Candidatus Omnitrophota bacterium]
LVAQRRKDRRLNPCICLQMIAIKENENQIEDFLDLASEVGVDEVFIKPARIDFFPKKFTASLPSDKKYIRPSYLNPREAPKRCLKPWMSFVINSAGVAAPCCEDVLLAYPIGDIFRDTIGAVWNGKRIQDFRHNLSHKIENNPLCKDCSYNVFFRSL